MIVVDSSVWIDYFNGRRTRATDLLDSLLERETVVVGDLILTEVLQGFRRERDYLNACRLFDSLVFMEMVGKELALQSARNYRLLRRKGVTVRKTIDVMIGTFCVAYGLPLLHDDKDFGPMTAHMGLRVVA